MRERLASAVRRVVAIAVVLLLGGALAAWLLVPSDASGPRGTGTTGRADVPAPDAPVRGCKQRVESGTVYEVDPTKQVAVGPLSLGTFTSAYRDAARRVQRGTLGGVVPMKSFAIVEAGARATIAVPHGQRRWLHLSYTFPFDRHGEEAVRLAACRRFSSPADQRAECDWAPRLACRSDTTQFSGGLLVDFDRAPRLARCGAVDVWIGDEPGPRRLLLFDPPRGACDDADAERR